MELNKKVELKTDRIPMKEKQSILKTGCGCFDRILKGGFKTREIYEIYGPRGVGKKFMLHQLLCKAILPYDKGGLDSSVIYFDVDGKLSLNIIKRFAPRFDLKWEVVGQKLSSMNIITQNQFVYVAEKKLYQHMEKVKSRIILVDNISWYLWEDYFKKYSPNDQFSAGKLLKRILVALRKAAKKYNAVVILTNQFINGTTMDGVLIKTEGLKSYVDTRIEFKFDEIDHRIQILTNNNGTEVSQKSCILEFTKDGFHDINY